jgi:hypothetical protein
VLRDSKWLNRKTTSTQISLIIGFTIILGLLIEGIQLLIGRTSEIIDIWRSIIGSLLAITFSKRMSEVKLYVIRIAKFLVIIFLLIEAWPLIKALTVEIQAKIDFPIIADFENHFELENWHGRCYKTINNEFVYHGDKSLKAVFLTTKYSGISIDRFPSDWQNYSKIIFNVYLPATDSLKLLCRINDKNHKKHINDWFGKSFYVKQGWNEISFKLEDVEKAPTDRKMDITNIKNFTLYTKNLKEQKTIYFDYLRLEQ